MIGRSQGYLAATVCVLGFGACDAPEQASDLRPSGPPEVLTVLTATGDDSISELATFCKANDDKRPSLVPAASPPADPHPDQVQVCPDATSAPAEEVTNTFPTNWFVRIQFDELLDPDVEELKPIRDTDGNPTGQDEGTLVNTLPVTLECNGTAVAYDGLYSPSGNSLSWPLGPSLFIQPIDTSLIATGSECSVSIKSSVVDKDGVAVPTDQQGPYRFKIAPLELTSTSLDAIDPSEPPMTAGTISVTAPVQLTFNAAIDVTSLDAVTEVSLQLVTSCSDAAGVPLVAKVSTTKDDPQTISISDTVATGMNAWQVGKTYLLTIPAAAAVVDQGGGTGAVSDEDTVFCFQTKA